LNNSRPVLHRVISFPLVGGVIRRLIRATRRTGSLPPQLEVEFNLSTRGGYAYCVYHAAALARRLNVPAISVLEFGVAGGNGLLFLDQFARRVAIELDVQIQVYGFDTGRGLPEVVGAENLPYWFQSSQYGMDIKSLRAAGVSATLVLGDVKETVKSFFAQHKAAPVGAILNDLDLYSSTSDSFMLFEQDYSHFLPRLFMYFDDVIGTEYEMYSPCNGQLLAISDFNKSQDRAYLGLNQNLQTRPDLIYRNQIYYAHLKSHPQYQQYIGAQRQRDIELALRLAPTMETSVAGPERRAMAS
jgi:hypothetical protein